MSCATANYRIMIMKANDYFDNDWYGIYTSCNHLDRFYFVTRKNDTDKGGNYDASISNNQWSYMVFTKTGLSTYFYINGKNVASGDAYSDLNTTTENFYIMGNPGYSRVTPGVIDEIRLYSSAISSSRIKEQYYTGLNNLLANNGIAMVEYIDRIKNLSSINNLL